MAYTLNTGHALYGNLIELFGVQSGALISHKTARTFTKHTDATYGTGTWGEHFTCVNGGYTAKGASFTPSIDLNTVANPAHSVFIAVNAIGAATGNFAIVNSTGNPDLGSLSPGITTSGHVTAAFGYTKRSEGTTAVGSGIRSFCTTRAGDAATDGKSYLDGVLESTGYSDGSRTNAKFDYIGGCDGQGSVGLSIVWVAIFNKVLSPSEILSLHNSLGANNAFGLVESAAGSNGTATGTPDSIDLIAPTATGNGTGSGTTNGSASGTPSSASLSAPSATGTGTTAGNGTITTPALKNNTGTVLASISGWTVNVYNASTGALVVQKTGLATNASGILTITDAAIASGTSYTYEPVHATYGRRLPTGAAS